ncbi:MAG: hypothetical protein IKA14_01340 [Bacteroidales bacterium]|nr:hypothetical protein [Bacteroidales bacterium]
MKTVEQLKKEVEETKLPQATKELFYKVLDTADESSLSESQRIRYESDLKNYMDTMSCIEFAEIKGKTEGRAEGLAEGRAEGLAEGRAEGKSSATAEIARSMKAEGMTIAMISKFTGLSAEEIGAL